MKTPAPALIHLALVHPTTGTVFSEFRRTGVWEYSTDSSTMQSTLPVILLRDQALQIRL